MQYTPTIKSTDSSAIPKNWEKDESVFTSDEVINAFFKGKEAGMGEYKRILLAQFKENLETATNLSEKFFQEITNLNIHPIGLRLKIEDISAFKALFIVKKQDFLDDSFRNVYTLSRKYKNESASEKFCISFSFTPYSEKLDEHSLIADGFDMKYEEK